jgi:hypothetical protein
VSERAIAYLEDGAHDPRLSTATALCECWGEPIQVVFPRLSGKVNSGHVGYKPPAVARIEVGITDLRALRRLADADLPARDRAELCAELAPLLDRFIAQAEERWPL